MQVTSLGVASACLLFVLFCTAGNALHQPWAERRVAVHVTRVCEQRLLRMGRERARFTSAVVFQEEVTKASYCADAGAVAVVFGPATKGAVGVGVYDPFGPLRVRLLHHGQTSTPVDDAWLASTVANACAERLHLFTGTDTTGYRVLNGENDGVPGLVVDRYGATFVAKAYSAAWLPWMEVVVGALRATLGPQCERVVVLVSRDVGALSPADRLGVTHGDVVYGHPLAGEVEFVENGLSFGCDPRKGQKTGFFLDQRENRERVRLLCESHPRSRVLNVFSYTGGFSVYAAAGSAAAVTSVDLSSAALDGVVSNLARNSHSQEVQAAEHREISGDAFAVMHEMLSEGQQFEVVVVDPPAFAQREKHIDGALAAYAKLARLAVQLCAPGGHVVLASCSAKVTAEAFTRSVARAAASAGRPLEVLEERGHALDHPVRAVGSVPYLKVVIAHPAA